MKPFVIGIDIGGTTTKLGRVDRQGQISLRHTLRTTDYPEIDAYIDALGAAIRTMTDTQPGDCTGIGIGAPNANYYTGEIRHAANLPWKGIVPLRDLLQKKLHLPVTVTNDANAAAMGEMRYGVAQGMRDFIVITLGTGVGSGIVSNGQLIYGHDGFAGELGHVIVKRGGRTCGCGRKGCLETYCSATGVARTARNLLRQEKDSLLNNLPLRKIDSKAVYEAAVRGDAVARHIFDVTGTLLGEALANFIAFSSPEAIILFGCLAQAGDLLLEPVRQAMNRNVLSVYAGGTRLLVSQLAGSDAAILGASALAWD